MTVFGFLLFESHDVLTDFLKKVCKHAIFWLFSKPKNFFQASGTFFAQGGGGANPLPPPGVRPDPPPSFRSFNTLFMGELRVFSIDDCVASSVARPFFRQFFSVPFGVSGDAGDGVCQRPHPSRPRPASVWDGLPEAGCPDGLPGRIVMG